MRMTEFAKREVKFVGHLVGHGRKRIDPDRLSVIINLDRPVTKKQLKSVLGLLGYHRAFISGYAEAAIPLTNLTSNKTPMNIPWTDSEQKAFDVLKNKLCSATALYTPRIGQPFVLRSDASGIAVAACLSQLGDGYTSVSERGIGERPVAFCSQKLTPTQRAWSVIEREAYAVIFALKKYHNLAFGSRIVVFCDHNPLSCIVDCVPKSAKLTRWSLALQAYDIVFRYSNGSYNVVADYLSRG
jgi:RNase H-like domain found in reverse transcriptase